MREIANEWLCKEKNTWEIVLKNAISKKEIKDDINIELFVDLFQNIYLGTSFAGVVHEDGYKIDQLKREFIKMVNQKCISTNIYSAAYTRKRLFRAIQTSGI